MFATSFQYYTSSGWDMQKLYIICNSYTAFEFKLISRTVYYIFKRGGGEKKSCRKKSSYPYIKCEYSNWSTVHQAVTEEMEAGG